MSDYKGVVFNITNTAVDHQIMSKQNEYIKMLLS